MKPRKPRKVWLVEFEINSTGERELLVGDWAGTKQKASNVIKMSKLIFKDCRFRPVKFVEAV